MSRLEIDKSLVLSTSHVPEALAVSGSSSRGDDAARMDDLASMTGEYGWLMYAGTEETPHTVLNDPKDADAEALAILDAALKFARSHGCVYIRFDRDADTIPDLPTFDW